MSGHQSNNETSGTRPEKLRKACNQCNIAKVKCSGERTGCLRCKTASTDCVYEESRVGKVPGTRAKKNKLPGGQESTIHQPLPSPQESQDEPANSYSSRNSSVCAASNWPTEKEPQQDGESSIPDQTELFDMNFDMDGSSYFGGQNMSDFNPESDRPVAISNANSMVQNDDFDFNSANYSSSTAYSGIPEFPGFSTAMNSEEHPQIVTNLETYLEANVRVLDIVLRTAKSTNQTLCKLIDLQQESKSHRCQAMLATILDQLIELFEGACQEFLERPGSSESNGIPNTEVGGGITAVFHFGEFQLSGEERRSWRARMILKELQHINTTLQRIVVLAQMSETALHIGQERGVSCHRDMETRLKALSDGMRKAADFC